MFFSEHWLFYLDTKIKKKKNIQQIVYGFSDNLISIGHSKFSLLLREYT